MLCLLVAVNATGQQQDSISSEQQNEGCSMLMSKLKLAQRILEAQAHGGVDTNYIEVPEKPWRVMVQGRKSAVLVDYINRFDYPDHQGHSDFTLRFLPPAESSIGFWAGYRGLGVSYYKSIAKNAGRFFSFGTTSAMYGLNFVLRRFNTDRATLTETSYENGNVVEESESDRQIAAPVWIRSAYINGYYVFNGRRYSQAAAYNQSVIQRRSAGSLLLGATFFRSSFDYSDSRLAALTLLSHNIGVIKLHQASIGVGYGYNFVPMRGIVINAMIMPSFSFYNRVTVDKYGVNYELSNEDHFVDDYGEWNRETHTWANGKTTKPILADDEEANWRKDIDSWYMGSETEHGALRFNAEMRVGVAYNWKNYFLGLQMQFDGYFYRKGDTQVNITDGFARLSMGVRL